MAYPSTASRSVSPVLRSCILWPLVLAVTAPPVKMQKLACLLAAVTVLCLPSCCTACPPVLLTPAACLSSAAAWAAFPVANMLNEQRPASAYLAVYHRAGLSGSDCLCRRWRVWGSHTHQHHQGVLRQALDAQVHPHPHVPGHSSLPGEWSYHPQLGTALQTP